MTNQLGKYSLRLRSGILLGSVLICLISLLGRTGFLHMKSEFFQRQVGNLEVVALRFEQALTGVMPMLSEFEKDDERLRKMAGILEPILAESATNYAGSAAQKEDLGLGYYSYVLP